MKKIAATALVVAAAPAPAAEAFTEGCQTADCHRRVTVKWGHRKAREKKRRVIAPHRGFFLRVAACESGGRWNTNTGNGFYGGLQFTLSSWAAVGGRGMPHLATPLEQMYRGVLLLRLQGPGAWPICSR